MRRSIALRRGLRPALRRAGLRQVNMHSLRHSFASALIMRGAPITEVQHLLGHASPSITLGVYSHFFKSVQPRPRTSPAKSCPAAKVGTLWALSGGTRRPPRRRRSLKPLRPWDETHARESGGTADAPDLGSGAARRGGSSPPSRNPKLGRILRSNRRSRCSWVRLVNPCAGCTLHPRTGVRRRGLVLADERGTAPRDETRQDQHARDHVGAHQKNQQHAHLIVEQQR